MLGLGNSLAAKRPTTGQSIVKDNLVLQHGYSSGEVQQVSTGAAYFDGDDDYIELGSQDGDLRLSGSNGSITAWVKPTITGGDTYQRIVDKSDSTSGTNGYALTIHDDGRVFCYIDGSNQITSLPSTALTARKWQHITWTWDGTRHKFYIDGVLDVSSVSSATPPSDTTNMRIGTWNHSTGREYNGYMCNVGIFESALTQSQIKSIMWKSYSDLSTGEKRNLVSWWNLDATAADGIGLVYDENNTTLGSNKWTVDPIGPDTLGGDDLDVSALINLDAVINGFKNDDVIKISGTISGSNGGRIYCPDMGASSNGVALVDGSINSHNDDGDFVTYVYVTDATGVLKMRTDYDHSGANDVTQQLSNIKVQKITNAGRLI